ncbi:hypothetical protein PQX77_012577 [Marasmius sp. AFHP31]|nr:hypothetical protein PQX77_012577 [Marasmius sp. AFHP31]
MAGSRLFTNASNVQIGDGATFPIAGRDQVTIYNDSGRESQWVTLNGDRYRRIPMGDIIARRNVSSTVVNVTVDRQTSRTSQEVGELKVVKVKKTTQHVGLLGLPGGFTAVRVEMVEKDQAEELSNIMDRLCREMSSQRSPLITQLVGLGWSERPTFIFHDELLNGDEYTDKIVAEGNWIVYYYLYYTKMTSLFILRGDKSLKIPVFGSEMFWTFNPRTHVWQYDVASVSISPPNDDTSFSPLGCFPAPLRHNTRPRLDGDGIIACFEEQFGHFLHLIASLGGTRHVEDLSDFARHGFLTFGAVVDRNKPRILAHIPSTPSPEWNCGSRSADVHASYSAFVPSRVDLSFQNTDSNQVRIDFSLCLSDALQRRTAYLSQSISFAKDCDYLYGLDLVFIDEIRFSLVGTFQYNPAKSTTPAYLFVPPVLIEVVDGVYCVRYPLPDTLFFWCSDPNGQDVIYEEDWETYEIPRLEILTWIGSSWYFDRYKVVHNHLQKRNYPLDGRQYALEYGYPELKYGDPHNTSIMVIEELDTTQEINGFSERSEYRDGSHHQGSNPDDDDNSVLVNPSSNEAKEIQQHEAPQTGTGAVTLLQSKATKRDPYHVSFTNSQNEYQPPAWP